MNNKVIYALIVSFIFLFQSCFDNKVEPLDSEESFTSEYYFNEPPEITEVVKNGLLPPVNQRLPKNPKLIQPDNTIGKYGGTWEIPIRASKNKGALVIVTGYENLVCWDPEWTKVIPNIAQSWSVNEDSTVYTFTLREGMKWSDGELFTADDILFYFEVVSNKEINRQGLDKWWIVDGSPVVVEKIDDYNISFTFKSSYGLFLQKLATTAGSRLTSMPKHYLEQFLLEINPDVSINYKENGYNSWQDQLFTKADFSQNIELPTLHAWLLEDTYYPLTTDKIIAKRNPYYWKIDTDFNQLPYIDTLEFIVCKDQADVDNRTIAGEFQMSLHDLPESASPVLKEMVEKGEFNLFFKTPSIMNSMTIEFNWNHEDPIKREMFQDKEFRIALSHAINRELIIKDIYGGNGEPYQLAPRPESPLYNEELAKQYTAYDPELAQEILEKNGYSINKNGKRVGLDGKPISINIVVADLFGKNWPIAVEYIKRDWALIGIDLTIELSDWQGLDAQRNNGTHDLLVWQGSGGLEVKIIPDYYLPYNSESGYAMKWMWWSQGGHYPFPSEEPPALVKQQMSYFDQLKSTADIDKQNSLMSEILKISTQQFYALGISLPGKSYGITASNFRNVPVLMPQSWAYPTPAPTNPCQYYFEF